ncbi:MAG: ABC transporter ATP-binding protein [Deferribacteraceae bacterium]|jgi:putative ABC transport system ATP-binding protein|nr:ABC transporter ATP-binding protein [Deferribacteraceae bacterium]
MNIITANNISKVYGNGDSAVKAVDDVSLELEKGEFLCILGRSGSGKSTLLNLLAALDKPTCGKLYFNGRDIINISGGELNKLRRKQIAVIFQFHHLLPYFTAEENVLLPCMNGITPVKNEHRNTARASLDIVGLSGKHNRLPNQLSGGEQQRVAIARAICSSPEILFADEPTGSLDKETGDSIIALLSELNKKGLTIVMITHQQDYAAAADRIINMENGKIKINSY